MLLRFWIMFPLGFVVGGSLRVTVTPSSPVTPGSSVQIYCSVITPLIHTNQDHCEVTWSRTYIQTRAWTKEEVVISGSHGNQPMYNTYHNSKNNPVSSTVYINVMSTEYQGTYICRLQCAGQTESANIVVELLTEGKPLGSAIGYIAVFISVGILLFVVGFMTFRKCCSHRGRRQAASRESLLNDTSTIVPSANDYAPPRYSLVISLPPDGDSSNLDNRLVSTSGECGNNDLPKYEEALRDLERRGIRVSTSKLQPMPPAYADVPYVYAPYKRSTSPTLLPTCSSRLLSLTPATSHDVVPCDDLWMTSSDSFTTVLPSNRAVIST